MPPTRPQPVISLGLLATFALLVACGGGASSTPDDGGPPATPPGGGPTPPPGRATLGSCTAFPADNPLNADISNYPLHPMAAAFMTEMNPTGTRMLHPDFGSNPTYGIPINIVNIPPSAYTPITFGAYSTESDPGPYPIPSSPKIEAPTDLHMLIANTANCKLYETGATVLTSSGWQAAGGAVFDLNSNALRLEGWTSGDAAGLPIAAGLVRYGEVQAGTINHAIRFTMDHTAKSHIHPATHDAGGSVTNAPPMGLRLRLKASYSLSSFTGNSLVILQAMKRYGIILADNGSDFFFTGETDTRWNDNDLNQLKSVPASAFEVVDTGPTQ